MSNQLLSLVLLSALALAACGSDDTAGTDDTGAGSDDTGTGADGGTDTGTLPDDTGVTPDAVDPVEDTTLPNDVTDPTDIAVDDTGADVTVDTGPGEDTTVVEDTTVTDTTVTDTTVTEDTTVVAGATLAGTITRSANPERGADGIGNVYVAVLDSNPLGFGGGTPTTVAVQLIENVDLSAAGASVDYRITGIPTRSEPYYISAFLDDDGNAGLDAPGPDAGDLLNLESPLPPSIPTLAITEEIEYTFPIDLNFARPF